MSDKFDQLADLFRECAEAMGEDTELNVGGNGVNPLEASRALQAVAKIFGVDGPAEYFERYMESGS